MFDVRAQAAETGTKFMGHFLQALAIIVSQPQPFDEAGNLVVPPCLLEDGPPPPPPQATPSNVRYHPTAERKEPTSDDSSTSDTAATISALRAEVDSLRATVRRSARTDRPRRRRPSGESFPGPTLTLEQQTTWGPKPETQGSPLPAEDEPAVSSPEQEERSPRASEELLGRFAALLDARERSRVAEAERSLDALNTRLDAIDRTVNECLAQLVENAKRVERVEAAHARMSEQLGRIEAALATTRESEADESVSESLTMIQAFLVAIYVSMVLSRNPGESPQSCLQSLIELVHGVLVFLPRLLDLCTPDTEIVTTTGCDPPVA